MNEFEPGEKGAGRKVVFKFVLLSKPILCGINLFSPSQVCSAHDSYW